MGLWKALIFWKNEPIIKKPRKKRKLVTQRDRVLRHLKNGLPLTQREAFYMNMGTRLSAHIHVLRRHGHVITCDKSKGYGTYKLQ